MGFALNFITDGTTEINLLDPKALFVDGWVQKIAQQKSGGFYSDSALADGADLVLESASNVVEELPLYIRGKDPDQIAAAGQLLFDLGYKLRQYSINPGRQTSPVYWGYRPKDQTNIQYALLKNYRVESATETHGHSFKGMIHKPATFVGTLFLEREPYWRDGPPGVLPTPLSLTHPDAPSMATIQSFSDYRNTFSLTHIYNFDSSAGTFSANQIGNAAFTYYPSPAGVDDIVYFGSTGGPFFNIVASVGTVGVQQITQVWEFWTGAAWTPASPSPDARFLINNADNKTGKSIIKFDVPSTWSRTTINSVNAYWIRVRIASFTSMSTNPTNVTEVVYAAKNEYIELDSGDLNGDLPAMLRLSLFNHQGSSFQGMYTNLVIIGAKSRGLTTFTSRLNWSGFNNPSPWVSTFGTGAIRSQDARSPSGERVGISFGTTANTSRVTMRQSTAAAGADYFGEYQVFVLCSQVGGSVGDVLFNLLFTLGAGSLGGVFTSQVSPQRVGTDIEIIDCGRIKIPPTGTNIIESSHRVGVSLYAEAASAVPQLFLYQLVLMPIDEWAAKYQDTVTFSNASFAPLNPSGSALVATSRLACDAGIIREECALELVVSSVSGTNALGDSYGYILPWEARGQFPRIIPKRTTRLYFLMGEYPSGSTSGSLIWNTGNGGLISVYAHNLYQYLRGDQ